MASLQVEVIIGIALGVLLGVAPAVGAAIVGSIDTRTERAAIPRTVVVGAGLVLAAAGGFGAGLFGVAASQLLRLFAALVVVGLLTMYGHSRGTTLAEAVSRPHDRAVERTKGLSSESLAAIDASGQVTIRPSGEIRSLDGYPSLSDSLEAAIADARFRLPADLPITELERRIERQLTDRFDLAAVGVDLDASGRATIAAAPPVNGIGHHVPDGYRAVSVRTVVPDGVARGDDVVLDAGTQRIEGTFLDATGVSHVRAEARDASDVVTDRDAIDDASATGSGALDRATVAVPTADADALLGANVVTVAVQSRDTRPDFRAMAALERAEEGVRFAVLDDALLDAIRADDAAPAVIAARAPAADASWQFDPSPSTPSPGWDAFLVGDRGALDTLVRDAAGTEPVVVES